jgi:protein-tyrosine-phosphatase
MKILFVCSGNAYRSPLAEALLRKLRPDLQVDSAGTQVETEISEATRKYLAKRGADNYLKEAPESLDARRLGDYDLIVAMEQVHENAVLRRCPECRGKTAVWNIKDLVSRPIEYTEAISNLINEKVKELTKSLAPPKSRVHRAS